MTQFQAGVGPSQDRCHIYRVGDDPRLSLCGRVCIARNYKADLVLSNMRVCLSCANRVLKIWVKERHDSKQACPPPEYLGVSSLEL